jgi:hypothetical protein
MTARILRFERLGAFELANQMEHRGGKITGEPDTSQRHTMPGRELRCCAARCG